MVAVREAGDCLRVLTYTTQPKMGFYQNVQIILPHLTTNIAKDLIVSSLLSLGAFNLWILIIFINATGLHDFYISVTCDRTNLPLCLDIFVSIFLLEISIELFYYDLKVGMSKKGRVI